MDSLPSVDSPAAQPAWTLWLQARQLAREAQTVSDWVAVAQATLATLREISVSLQQGNATPSFLARVWSLHGQALHRLGPSLIEEAISAYREAWKASASVTEEDRLFRARAQLNLGLAHLSQGETGAASAVEAFRACLEELDHCPRLAPRLLRALALVHRADAWSRTPNGSNDFAVALQGCDQAIALLRTPSPSDAAEFQALATAWALRGSLLAQQNPPPPAAAEAFTAALLAAEGAGQSSEALGLQLSLRLNLLPFLQPEQQVTTLGQSLVLAESVPVAQASLAPWVVETCLLHTRLATAAEARSERLASLTDAVELGLRWLRLHSGARQSKPEAQAELLRLGLHLYRTHQPHFLGEFVQEQLSPDEGELLPSDLWQEAAGVLLDTLRSYQEESFFRLSEGTSENALSTLRSLREAAESLQLPLPGPDRF